MTCIIVTIQPETRTHPVRVRAHIRGCSLTLDYNWNKPARMNAYATAWAFRDQHFPGVELGLCKEISRNKYKFPLPS